MEIRNHLRELSKSDHKKKKAITQIEFNGERFDVQSIRKWRDRILNPT